MGSATPVRAWGGRHGGRDGRGGRGRLECVVCVGEEAPLGDFEVVFWWKGRLSLFIQQGVRGVKDWVNEGKEGERMEKVVAEVPTIRDKTIVVVNDKSKRFLFPWQGERRVEPRDSMECSFDHLILFGAVIEE